MLWLEYSNYFLETRKQKMMQNMKTEKNNINITTYSKKVSRKQKILQIILNRYSKYYLPQQWQQQLKRD